MARPLVSTVIPTYNNGRYVREAIESVQRQTHQPVEIIVVDDGSTDDTRTRLARFGDSIRCLYQENKGPSCARNRGILAATGEWIAFLDADDLWHPQKLQIQLDAVSRLGDVSFVGSPECGPWADSLDPNPEVRRLRVRDFFVSTPLHSSSALVKRSCFDKVGLFDETLRGAEDRDVWLRLAAAFSGATVMSPCVSCRRHPEQSSRKSLYMYTCLKIVFGRFFEQHPEYSDLRPVAEGFLHQDAGFAYFETGDRWSAIGHMVRSVLAHPRPLEPETSKYLRTKVLVHLILGERLFRRLKGWI